jgi:hypothetical protein
MWLKIIIARQLLFKVPRLELNGKRPTNWTPLLGNRQTAKHTST